MRTLFGPFTLDTDTRQLSRDGQALHLSPKAFDVLRALVEARPGVIDKSALHARIWPGTFVVDANLSVLIAEIRRALGDTPKDERFIRTVHRIGYSFCAEATDGAVTPRSTASAARCWLVVKDRHLVLPAGVHDIGRDPACTVWVEASGVSRRHARIHIDAADGDATVEDLGSTNGTFLEGKRVERPSPLTDGDAIQLGAAKLVFRRAAGGTLPATERIRRR